MMLTLFKDKKGFTVIYFIILLIDIVVKLYAEDVPFRYLSKPLVVVFLMIYYVLNNNETSVWRKRFIYMALLCFLIGDILFIETEITPLYITATLLFIVGKLFYAFRFSNQRDFSLVTLFPLFSICFIYMIVIMALVINSLGTFFMPTLIYLFVSLIVVLFAFLRKEEVIYKSFILVLIGVIVAIFSETIVLIKSFYNPNFPYHNVLIMLFYGVSQYLIVYGLVEEVKVKRKIITS
ncbi:lysoplasmalogenase [Lacinutrix neustonica]|uniref:Lysoplasmalogenase n=1 Tax=Lacinutrix neustonica TaxID=2980107 RepID=A0A9E8MVD2_9FLAO|nr:lysoplasmalogenase [Lacinutrix neustonica]WAC02066.1 lysoplasmalogenase [Lacinutrix neustonica]